MKSNVLLVALSAAVLASCGGASGSASDPTTLGLTSTNYVTVTQTPTTVTTTTLPGADVAAGTVHPEEGTYTLTDADVYPSKVASKFKVVLAELLAINGLSLDANQQVPGWPGAGGVIKLPPGWSTPGAAAVTTDTSATAGGATNPPSKTTTTIKGGQSTCAPGEYTIVAGDVPSKVANKLNTTVAELDAANAGTKGYKSFYVGLKIKTPPKASC
jgi:LysM repeat protein